MKPFSFWVKPKLFLFLKEKGLVHGGGFEPPKALSHQVASVSKVFLLNPGAFSFF